MRGSAGNRAVADRLLFSANIDPSTGLRTPGGKAAALAPLEQAEVGVKNQGKTGFGHDGVLATLYHSATGEFDVDQTRQGDPTKPNCAGPKRHPLGCKADGVALETALSAGAFAVKVNLSHFNEGITSKLGNVSAVGKPASGVPEVRDTLSPRDPVDGLTFGATVRGHHQHRLAALASPAAPCVSQPSACCLGSSRSLTWARSGSLVTVLAASRIHRAWCRRWPRGPG